MRIGPAGLLGLLGLLPLACSDEGRPPAAAPASGAASAGASAGGSAAAGPTASAGEGGSAVAGAAGSAAELLPACIPRQECRRLCEPLGEDPASCGLGDARQCGCLCEERFGGPCPEELSQLVACIGDAPAVDCAARGRLFPGCEDESFALEACDFAAREQLCARDTPACTPYCRALKGAFCARGPESAASCLCGCEATLVTTCAAPFEAFMACSAGEPSFTCDGDGRPRAASCDGAWQTLAACFVAPAASASDAGPTPSL